jgi:hypothetical protein
MKIVEIHEYVFPSHLLPALINNDHGSVTDEDRESFDAFLVKLERYKKMYNATDYMIEYSVKDKWGYKADSYFSWTNCLNNVGCSVTDIKVLFLS